MITEKQKSLKRLKIFYLGIVFLTIIFVAPTHFFPPPSFMPFRFPHYLEMMGPFLGVSWPTTFKIYHYAIYALAIIGSLNTLGIIFYPKLNKITFVSSLSGIFLILSMVLFFFFVFLSVNAPTAVVYGFYSVVLLTVDILTFKVLIMQRKEASRG